ncbi:MAG: hypothetical protein JJD92_04065 [Frankiaceae bacterium]|nr:hypothetical protein [Frankiaceae bacterium]
MKTRATLLAASLLITGAVGAVSAADAKGKPVCNLVTDATGDANLGGAPGGAGDDIVSADFASDGKTLTGVVRMAALAANDPEWLNGRAYFAEFTAPGSPDVLFVQARAYPTGVIWSYGYSGVDPTSGVNTSYTLGQATGVVDVAKKEVRVSAPLKGFIDGAKVKLASGTKLKGIGARVYRQGGQGLVPSQEVGGTRVPLSGLNVLLDDATGGSYVIGTPSCVAVGK